MYYIQIFIWTHPLELPDSWLGANYVRRGGGQGYCELWIGQNLMWNWKIRNCEKLWKAVKLWNRTSLILWNCTTKTVNCEQGLLCKKTLWIEPKKTVKLWIRTPCPPPDSNTGPYHAHYGNVMHSPVTAVLCLVPILGHWCMSVAIPTISNRQGAWFTFTCHSWLRQIFW